MKYELLRNSHCEGNLCLSGGESGAWGTRITWQEIDVALHGRPSTQSSEHSIQFPLLVSSSWDFMELGGSCN